MKVKIFHSPASPFVRKVLVSAHEKGVYNQIEKLPSKAWPVKRDPNIVKENPSGKVPTALLDDDTPLFDSRVICAYIDTLSNSLSLYPENLKDRFSAMTLEALADSILDAALLCRYESVLRPQEYYWALWHDSQMEKVDSGLDDLENRWLKFCRGRSPSAVLRQHELLPISISVFLIRTGEVTTTCSTAGLLISRSGPLCKPLNRNEVGSLDMNVMA